MSRSRFAWRAALTAACVICGCMAPVAALACAYENYPSVHFNTKRPDFGAPPRPFSIPSWGEAPYRPIGSTPRKNLPWNQEYYLQARWEARGLEALANARRLESSGRFEQSIEHYRNALKHGAGDPAAIRDRAEVYSELTPPLDRELLNEYLSARRDYEFSRLKRANERLMKLAANPRAGFLRPHALYVLGAIQYDRARFSDAAAAFERLVALYPHSPRREASLIMIPRSLIRSPVPNDRFPDTWLDKPLPGAGVVARSRKALQVLLRDYPRSRFRANALGWLARCDYVQGRRVAALESYLRQYGTLPRDYRTNAASSIYFVSRTLTPADAIQLRADLRNAPSLLAPYLDFRLYHGPPERRDLPRLADLASGAARRHRLRLGARISARLAEIQYLRGRCRDAICWSNRALSSLSADGKDLAIYVRGASRRKTGRTTAAVSDFRRLLRQYPKSYLCGAARENLALLYERRGRPDLALDYYFTLGYQEDIAYILDACMTTRQVRAYVHSHPHHPQRDLLVYTLGIRQLRDNRLADAARTLSRLPDRTVRRMMARQTDDYWWRSIHTWARDPRETARDLAHLQRAVSKARGSNARAGALFAQASYIYQNRDLLFYNAALWHGERSAAFGWYWDAKVATRRDQSAVRRHHHEHECLCRARELCLDIANRYPRSPVAPKALYRAACATYYLVDFNDWWRSETDRIGLWDQSVRLMKRVYQRYPHDPLARPARKYATVFASDMAQAARSEMFDVAKK